MGWFKRKANEFAEKQEARRQADAEAAQQREAEERAYNEEVIHDLGVVAFQRDGGIRINANDAAERKLAIQELRLQKKELTAKRRELTAEIAATRAEQRTRVAGRHSTVGLPRGTAGRMIRAGVQAKRRSERMQVDDAIVPLEQERNGIDRWMIEIDRAIARIEAARGS